MLAARRTPSKLAASRRRARADLSRAFGVFLEGWATRWLGAPCDRLAELDMRRGVEHLREQNSLFSTGS